MRNTFAHLYTNTQCIPHCACCQTAVSLLTLYSVRDPENQNPARQMQNSLVKAALTGAVSTDLLNQRDNANKCVALVNRVGFAPVHMMALVAKHQLATHTDTQIHTQRRKEIFAKGRTMQ